MIHVLKGRIVKRLKNSTIKIWKNMMWLVEIGFCEVKEEKWKEHT